ncbi:MAG TPA: hypothetical protein ENN87_11655 [Phycisphaerales bacterium]|nr:hypothetical protein [Phycisphaerales bacterium]
MGDTLKKVKPGDPMVIPADTFNTFVDAARGHVNRRHGWTGRPMPSRPDPCIILVYNNTGQDLDRYNIIAVQDHLYGPSYYPGDPDAERSFKNSIVMTGIVPRTSGESFTGRFAVLLEPLAAGKIGRAVISGVVQVRLEVKEQAAVRHYAGIVDNEVGYLGESVAGPARILWKDLGASGIVWAVVRLSDQLDYYPRAIHLEKTGGEQGGPTTHCTWTYTVSTENGVVLGTDVDPAAGFHLYRRPEYMAMNQADKGVALFTPSGSYIISWINETPIHPNRTMAVVLVQTGGSSGDGGNQCSWTYTVKDAASGNVMGENVNPTQSPHKWRRPATGSMLAANYGYANLAENGVFTIGWINEILG